MRRLAWGLIALLWSTSAFAQYAPPPYIAHTGDPINYGATNYLWCSLVPVVTGTGSVSIAANGATVAGTTGAFAGMTVEAIHASNVYTRTGFWWIPAPGSVSPAGAMPSVRFATVTAKTDSSNITIADGNLATLVAETVPAGRWGYWVSACQRTTNATTYNLNESVHGPIIPAVSASVGGTTPLRMVGKRAFTAYYTADAASSYSAVLYCRPSPAYYYPSSVVSVSGGSSAAISTRYPVQFSEGVVNWGNRTTSLYGCMVQITCTASDGPRPIIGVEWW